MRTLLLLLAAMLAMNVSNTTGASAQDACSNPYIACVDKCVARPSKTLQESCIEVCQNNNRSCAASYFGTPDQNSATAQRPAASNEAVAENEDKPAAKRPKNAAKTQAPKRQDAARQ